MASTRTEGDTPRMRKNLNSDYCRDHCSEFNCEKGCFLGLCYGGDSDLNRPSAEEYFGQEAVERSRAELAQFWKTYALEEKKKAREARQRLQ
jgi:hypothetical protein